VSTSTPQSPNNAAIPLDCDTRARPPPNDQRSLTGRRSFRGGGRVSWDRHADSDDFSHSEHPSPLAGPPTVRDRVESLGDGLGRGNDLDRGTTAAAHSTRSTCSELLVHGVAHHNLDMTGIGPERGRSIRSPAAILRSTPATLRVRPSSKRCTPTIPVPEPRYARRRSTRSSGTSPCCSWWSAISNGWNLVGFERP
jgi:hypothetical protein